jgi:hypothetical protein
MNEDCAEAGALHSAAAATSAKIPVRVMAFA